MACDSYHRYKEDVALLKELGAKAYRFSISWSRVIPLGGRKDPVNEKGLQYYAALVDELLANGIEPMITLFHWDLPQALHDRYGGFLNQNEYVQDYVNFARVLFRALGSKVKKWITYNEPWCTSILGYNVGQFAPGHTSDRAKNAVGDGSTEPWIVGHSILISHGAAVKVYREEFKPKDGGIIGMTLNGDWVEPWDESDPKDVEACERKLEFSISWFADPIVSKFKSIQPEMFETSANPLFICFSTTATTQRACEHSSENDYHASQLTKNRSSWAPTTSMA